MVGLKIRLDEPVFSHNGEMCSVFSHQAAAVSIFKKKYTSLGLVLGVDPVRP